MLLFCSCVQYVCRLYSTDPQQIDVSGVLALGTFTPISVFLRHFVFELGDRTRQNEQDA